MLSFKPAFSLSFFTFIKRCFSSFLLSPLGWYHCISEVVDIALSNLDSSVEVIQSRILHDVLCGFPGGSDGKESAYNVGDLGPIPW